MEYKVFGCRVNKYYTDKWLNSAYLQDKSGVFVASCVVTDKAKRKWIKFVKQVLTYLGDNEKVYISGCGAFERGASNEKFFEVYTELSIFKDKIEVLPEDPEDFKKNTQIKIDLIKLKKLTQIYTKKFIVIQGGCDSHCSFCLTVLKRGKHFFRSKEDILEEILDFEKGGGKEIVITGVNLGAWGLENTNIYKISKLSEILEYILDNSKIQRIRISSIGPEYIDDKLIEIFENPRILPFFHLSIQSGSTKVLKEMRRHYDRNHLEKVLEKLNNIQRSEGIKVSIGADLIVGFPGETEDEFLDTFNLVRDYKISKLHAFPFSAHNFGEKVPASDFQNQVDEKTKKDRLDRLIALGNEVRDEFIKSQMDVVHEVLIETVKKDNFSGQTKNYIDVTKDNFEIISGTLEKNSIVTGKITKVLSLENEGLNSEG